MFSFSRVKIAIRFFFMGLAIGVLLAPRSGVATRRRLRERADRLINDLLDAATLGAYDPANGDALNEDADDAEANEKTAPRQRRTAASAKS